jgi:formate hydrogenlyase subunit 6/NADH:ubiquinone oxidoreductase subunit I
MIRCIFCGYCEEACPVDAIKLGQEYELADYERKDFVYTKPMLLDPDKYAPKRQYHPEVDKPRAIDVPRELDLGEVYRDHRPLEDGS